MGPERWGRREYCDEIRNEQVLGKRVSLSAQRRAECQLVLPQYGHETEVNSTPARLRYNNFGYTLGGPALPTRKRLFFFFSQEWRRSTRDKWMRQLTVPDPNWLTDPASTNFVPPEARDPNAVKLLTLWPAPNVPGTNRYRTPITHEFDTRQEFVRADYNVVANWSLTGRYLHDRVDSRGEPSTDLLIATWPAISPSWRRGE